MNGLRIQVNFSTGKRSGGIDPRDRGLRGHPLWQDIDGGVEIRVITDGRSVDRYRSTDGVTVLEGDDAVQAAINGLPVVETFDVVDALLPSAVAEYRKGGGNPQELAGLSAQELYGRLADAGVIGVTRRQVARPPAATVLGEGR